MNNRYRVEVNQNSLQYQCQDQADLHHNLKQKISKKKRSFSGNNNENFFTFNVLHFKKGQINGSYEHKGFPKMSSYFGCKSNQDFDHLTNPFDWGLNFQRSPKNNNQINYGIKKHLV